MDAVLEYLDGEMPEARAAVDYEDSDKGRAILAAKRDAAREAVLAARDRWGRIPPVSG